MYRLMQLSKTTIPNAAAHTHMFTRDKNRVEFIVDFPRNDDAEIISSIQVCLHIYIYFIIKIIQINILISGTSTRLECIKSKCYH